MRTVSIGCQSFQFLREHDLFYVDKTPFLSKWYRGMDIVTLITRPRRFGKTLTLDMVRCFFSTEYHDRRDLFADLMIESDEELMQLQGTVPVIFLSFAGEHPANAYDFVSMFVTRIAELYSDHRTIMEDDRFTDQDRRSFQALETIPDVLPEPVLGNGKLNPVYSLLCHRLAESIRNLSRWIEKHDGRKVFILLDEYDAPLQSACLHGYWDDIAALMREFFGKTFKTNAAMERAIMTGTLRIDNKWMFSGMNHLALSSVCNGVYEDAFGFVQAEVEDALDEFGVMDRKEDVKSCYGGFSNGKTNGIYNPWSVCNYLNDPQHRLKSYVTHSSCMALVDHLFQTGSQDVLMLLQQLLLGESLIVSTNDTVCFPEFDRDPASVWSLLLASGYVRKMTESEAVLSNRLDDAYTLTFTNQEMKDALADMSKHWFYNNKASMHRFVERC